MKLHEVAHEIDHMIYMGLDVEHCDVGFLLDYLKAGYDADGYRIDRSLELEKSMRCIDCDDKSPHCHEDCPVWAVVEDSIAAPPEA